MPVPADASEKLVGPICKVELTVPHPTTPFTPPKRNVFDDRSNPAACVIVASPLKSPPNPMPVEGATGPEKVADPKFKNAVAVAVESASALSLQLKKTELRINR